MLVLERWEGEAAFLSPLRAFERERQAIEFRRDPLTGHITAIVRGREQYVLKHFRSSEEDVRRLAEETRPNCPFCPEALEEKTPRFPPELLPEGRLRVGDCWAVPALFAHTELNAIVILGREHYRPLDAFDERTLADGLEASIRLLRAATRARPELRFATIIMNYLPTAGASLLHPHMQVLATGRPFNKLRELLSHSLRHYLATSRCFWQELVEHEEREGARLVGRLGRAWWLAPFAPERRYEVWGLVEGASDLLALSREDMASLASGTSRVLAYYAGKGLSAFNLAILAGPLGQDVSAYFWLQVRICARFGLSGRLSDFWALPALLGQDEIFKPPEEYAAELRPYFR